MISLLKEKFDLICNCYKQLLCCLNSRRTNLCDTLESICVQEELQVKDTSGSRGGGPRGPGPPPLTPSFEAPKLSILGPYLILFLIFFASLRSAYFFFNILLFFTIRIQKFSSLALLGISFLI